MEISLDRADIATQIRSYQAGKIVINDKQYQQPIVITPEKVFEKQPHKDVKSLDIEYFKAMEFEQYEVVIVGTGENLIFPDWELLEAAQCLGTPLEVMATDAACGTFTLLANEGRKVLAILYP